MSAAGLRALLNGVRYEVLPAKATEDKVLAHVPRDVVVTVTASPVKGLEPTLDLTARLAAHGHRVVPHVPARLLRDDAHLKDVVDRLREAGVDDVFVPAGDADPPAGAYDGALPVLRALSGLGAPFARVGVTGYPESHPLIHDDVTVQAMWDKREHATYIVSNLCFDPRVLGEWIARIRRRGIALPVHVGVAGPVQRAKLLSMATKIGVGESTRFLTKHPSWFLRFATPGGYAPERLLTRTGEALTAPASGVAGLHLFTFNQIAETEAWRRALLERLGD
ncbi:methylenetetrahydrofolate reductase [Streptomyces europaeiscabiei]|uniref:5,10-methylenetetrahydrofolate reductase n=1 Tax=Streptomyces europaeiscabiei TaxID=146819 RepID=UPI0029B85706|nr:5,10-methylenetetrahydrofolate reductase [Streptomyces europaeiscabiei]MDX2527260.1 methylenetetrahydrofolate reductase [Streptomyces europaeiscabiei]MDX2761210.1 methylenetetrahydrofolate reductase [Streptomyces europaeiscabiei]MDX3777997.1 methylenetetrahydrofolate reductase [Streptomyces europaeiscabiei]MDX3862799.1 methylenetetrahydrofolate reductase [Streptomyces europaeiscabiei]MDX3872109.1 methylenetetrahydrofolate reductase [Streptomyces europaeiscabiei]